MQKVIYISRVAPTQRSLGARLRSAAALLFGAAIYLVCLKVAEVEPTKLLAGLPRLASWAGHVWPPDFSEIDTLLLRAAQTVAMGTVGTSFAAVLAIPLCILAARNLTPTIWAYYPVVFAMIFVAAVGLGPFAGVLGVALHMAGSIAKLWSESIEAVASR